MPRLGLGLTMTLALTLALALIRAKCLGWGQLGLNVKNRALYYERSSLV